MSASRQQLNIPEASLATPEIVEPEGLGSDFKFELEPVKGAGVRRLRGCSCVVIETACVTCVTCT